MGLDTLEFTVKNKKNFPKWTRITKACVSTRKDLIKYAPTLYDKLIYSALLVAWEGTKYAGSRKGAISDSIAESALKNPNVAGRGAGIIAGKLGMGAFNGRISVLSAVWTALFTVATKAAAVPGAVTASLDEIKKSTLNTKIDTAQAIITVLRGSNISITKDEAVTIAGEVMDHPKELLNSISDLAKAFKENS